MEAERLAKAGVVLDRAIRSCGGASGVGEAKLVAAESARVGKQLAAASTEGQVWAGATIARRGKRASSAQLPSARQTRSAASRAGATLASVEVLNVLSVPRQVRSDAPFIVLCFSVLYLA